MVVLLAQLAGRSEEYDPHRQLHVGNSHRRSAARSRQKPRRAATVPVDVQHDANRTIHGSCAARPFFLPVLVNLVAGCRA
eukprot:9479792-Pyramimonas_sp.AAC.1